MLLFIRICVALRVLPITLLAITLLVLIALLVLAVPIFGDAYAVLRGLRGAPIFSHRHDLDTHFTGNSLYRHRILARLSNRIICPRL